MSWKRFDRIDIKTGKGPSLYVDGKRVDKAGTLRWQQENEILSDVPYKWELIIPKLVQGEEVGVMCTDIWVYKSGRVSWPGREIDKFDAFHDAMVFVETTFRLEHPDECE